MSAPTVSLRIGDSTIALEEGGEILEAVDYQSDGTPDWLNAAVCDGRGAGGWGGYKLLKSALAAAEENARACGFTIERVPKPKQRRVMLPYKVLVWVEVDLNSTKVVDVRVSDLLENYDTYPAPNGDGVPVLVGLWNLEDTDEDTASEADTRYAVEIAEAAATASDWPALRIEESSR